ncbi:MAG TPA: hypothetical protein ENI23_17265 [bacterium]|nr:hypothetical protein [bacterium]
MPKTKEKQLKKGFTHPLAQNKEKHGGYAVFTFKFNGVPIKFVTLADVKVIRTKALVDQQAGFRKMVEGIESDYPKAKNQREHDLQIRGVEHAVKIIKDQLLEKLDEK